MAITWILVAHGSAGRILDVRKNGEQISIVKEFIHLKTAKRDSAISTNRPSRSPESNEPMRHSIDYSGEMEDHERQVFAKEIADYLAKALMKNDFSNLILVASRNMLGELRKAVANPVKKVISHELDKDLTSQGWSESELVEKIRDDLGLVCL